MWQPRGLNCWPRRERRELRQRRQRCQRRQRRERRQRRRFNELMRPEIQLSQKRSEREKAPKSVSTCLRTETKKT